MCGRIKLAFWHSSIGNKVSVSVPVFPAFNEHFIQEIYLVEVSTSVNKSKLPSDWTKTGGTKVKSNSITFIFRH